MRLVAAAAPSLKAQRSGSVVLITSSGNLWPRAGYALYSAARAAANSMVRAWAKEFGPYGVSVNAIAPNFLDNEYYVPSAESDSAYHQRMSELVPFGRFGRQEELSALIRFLANGETPFVSGQVIGFNGGWG